MKKALILANGKAPKKKDIEYLISIGYSKLICADGGANSARKLNILPDLIIGDLDSISYENKNFFKKKVDIVEVKRQNDTDVEKALKYLIKKKYKEVILLGSTGDRLDHTICNLGIVLKFYNNIRIKILHQKSFLVPYSGNIQLNTIIDETISLYGFSDKTKITSNGLKYPLKNMAITFGKKESTSNVATKNNVSLKISEGVVFIIRDFNLLKNNGLI